MTDVTPGRLGPDFAQHGGEVGQRIAHFDWSNTPIPYHSPYFFLAFMASVLTASFYIYRHFEMPAQDAIRKKLSAAATPSRRVWIADNRALKG